MLEWIGYLIFGFLAASAGQDYKTGRVFTPLLIVPVALLGWAFMPALAGVFAPVFSILLIIWAVCLGLSLRYNVVISFGMADVIALPLSLSLTQAMLPFWGPVLFAGTLAAEMPILHKRKFHRFLPWLIAPTATALVVSLLI